MACIFSTTFFTAVYNQDRLIFLVELGDKELFGHPKIVPYPYEVNGKLVTGNGSLTPICSLSTRSLSPSLTVLYFICQTHVPIMYRRLF